ncbi:flagellar basal-body rod protein FlgF [Acuticoccus sp. MNP-M23]|uniref:flagellar basal-body rod protein FlgF n=1 Tax=Acuticoccus sp. MNP-M23 TaxID=3072793 RepID=UPI0028157CE3|nr:flagellar basal-body rod protein FlgF [Acuticoccus sp. MNP-M23]WMS41806.1 flagellar basal-body rod protein FlgF [Acuticoccus sp. MNP-M23]
MPSDLYVTLSGQITMDTRLSTVANNVANMRTAGFRAETVDFGTILSATRSQRVAFATVGEQHIERQGGPVEATGNPLDIAVVGEGWFGVQTPTGLAYTRDGRFTVTEAGDLMTLTGFNVVDEGGAPIALDPERGEITVAADGAISQEGVVAGNVGLFAIAEEATLTRYGDTAVLSNQAAEPIVDRTANGVRQGYREGSNVNPVQAITELITVQRAFEYGNTAMRDRFQTVQQAVRTLGAD